MDVDAEGVGCDDDDDDEEEEEEEDEDEGEEEEEEEDEDEGEENVAEITMGPEGKVTPLAAIALCTTLSGPPLCSSPCDDWEDALGANADADDADVDVDVDCTAESRGMYSLRTMCTCFTPASGTTLENDGGTIVATPRLSSGAGNGIKADADGTADEEEKDKEEEEEEEDDGEEDADGCRRGNPNASGSGMGTAVTLSGSLSTIEYPCPANSGLPWFTLVLGAGSANKFETTGWPPLLDVEGCAMSRAKDARMSLS